MVLSIIGVLCQARCLTSDVVPIWWLNMPSRLTRNMGMQIIAPESMDCVHSSHCLEHMHDPVQCLQGWWKCVRPGGFIITVVPEENLYEQHLWPPRFNKDRKSTFRLGGKESWSPVSFDAVSYTHLTLPTILLV